MELGLQQGGEHLSKTIHLKNKNNQAGADLKNKTVAKLGKLNKNGGLNL